MTLTAEALQRAIKLSPYAPLSPTAKQLAFLMLPHREALFGGSAGPGKSVGLLMAALQYTDCPDYAALILRRTFAELSKPDALMDVADTWFRPTDARWEAKSNTWRFPSGASLGFGYLQNEADKYQYQSAQYHFIGFDELTAFTETQYRYLFSRLRRVEGSTIPIRMRAASNPGNIGHNWVKQRFMVDKSPDRVFLPATLDDNPYLDKAEYVKTLAELDPITRARLLAGDWTVTEGGMFRREWFSIIEERPAGLRLVRYWDLAATEQKRGNDPDETAGALIGLKDGIWYICDIRHGRMTPGNVEALIKQTAEIDGKAVAVRMEQEPGASGKNTIDHYARRVLVGYDYRGIPSTGSKAERARPLSSAAQSGNVRLVRGPWCNAFLDQMEAFPMGGHDDLADSASGAMMELTGGGLQVWL